MVTNTATGVDVARASVVVVARSTVLCPGVAQGAVTGVGGIGFVLLNPPPIVTSLIVHSCRVRVAVILNTIPTGTPPPGVVGGIGAVLTGAAANAAFTAVVVSNTNVSVGPVAGAAAVGGVGVAITAGTAINNTSIDVTGSNCTIDSVSTIAGGVAVGLIGVAALSAAPGLALTQVSIVTSNCTASVGRVTATVVTGGVGVSSWNIMWQADVRLAVMDSVLAIGQIATAPTAVDGPQSVVGGIGAALYQSPSGNASIAVVAVAVVASVGNISSPRSLASAVGVVGVAASSTSPLAAAIVRADGVSAQVGLITVTLPTTTQVLLTVVGGFGVALSSSSPLAGVANVTLRNGSFSGFALSTPDLQVAVGVAGVACAKSLVPAWTGIFVADVFAVVRQSTPPASPGGAAAVVGGVGVAFYADVALVQPLIHVAHVAASNATIAVGNWSHPAALSQAVVGAIGVAHRVLNSQLINGTVTVSDAALTVGTVRGSLAVGAVGVAGSLLLEMNRWNAHRVSRTAGGVHDRRSIRRCLLQLCSLWRCGD
jgi:hypothetical protein